MAIPNSVDGILRELAGSARNGQLAILAGAGISIPSGIPGARGIADSILSAVMLDSVPPRVKSLPLEVMIGSLGGSFYGEILEIFSSSDPTFEHYAIATLMLAGCTRRVATTNFDELIEKAVSSLEPSGQSQLDASLSLRLSVDHLHGHVSDPPSVKVAAEDVLRNQSRPELRLSLRELLGKDSPGLVLVLGYSFSDEFDINPALRDLGAAESRLIAVDHEEARSDFQLEDLDDVLNNEMKGRLQGVAIRCDTRALLSLLLTRLALKVDFDSLIESSQTSSSAKLANLHSHLLNARSFCRTVIRINLTEAAWWTSFDSSGRKVEIPPVELSRMSSTADSPEDNLIANYLAAVALGRRIATIRQLQIGSSEPQIPLETNRRMQQMRVRMFTYGQAALQLLDRVKNPSPLLEAQCKLLHANSLVEEEDSVGEGILIIEDLLGRYQTTLPPTTIARLSSLMGNLYRVAGMPDAALPYLEEADRIFQAHYMALETFLLLPALIETYNALGGVELAREATLRYNRVLKANVPTLDEPGVEPQNGPAPRITYGKVIPILIDPLPDVVLSP